jgi:hypothetical protein
MPGRSLVWFSRIYNNLAGITVKPRYRILGILGHTLRNKIPIVGNQGASEVGSTSRLVQLIVFFFVLFVFFVV